MDRRKEKLIMKIAWALPRIIAYWAFVRVATENYNDFPGDRKVIDAMRSWRG